MSLGNARRFSQSAKAAPYRLSVTLEGWLVTACSLGAYVVVVRKSERMHRSSGGWSFIPPPRVFNACFVFLTVGMAGSMIVSAVQDLEGEDGF